ncbi:MAG: bacterial Ig-like domain-containing protein [Clostridia bacterium]|nr:bacterial Ig-like domain-containing protein [Clostridia bacterium]
MKKILAVLLTLIAVISFAIIPVGAEDKAVSDIWVTKMPDKTEYYVGESVDLTGLEIGVAYTDGTSEIVNSGIECDTTVLNHKGTAYITISYMGEPEVIPVKVDFSLVQKIVSLLNDLANFFVISFKNIVAWF